MYSLVVVTSVDLAVDIRLPIIHILIQTYIICQTTD